MLIERPKLVCAVCNKTPGELIEYILFAEENEMTPDEYVWQEEGTLNRNTGYFVCTDDYFTIGMPIAPGGWTVPDEGLM